MEVPLTTEDGEEIDAEFGAESVEARIVNSAYLIGTTSTLMRVIGERAADVYYGKTK